jgi:hypothetical protein
MQLRIALMVSALALTACASRTYRPAVQEPLSKVVSNGCGRNGDTVMVTGQVSQASENSIVLADSTNSTNTLAVNLPGRGSPSSTMRRWFGTSKYELTDQRLNELKAQGTPLMVTMECKGPRLTPVARSIEFPNPDGTRVEIAY